MKNLHFKILPARIKGALSLLILLSSVAIVGGNIRAQEREYSLALDLPLQYIFTGDISGASTPSGFKAMLHLPLHFSVGLEQYSVEVNDISANINTELEFELLDLMISFELGPILVGLGYGMGTIATQSFQVAGSTFGMEDADASQIFITLGWMTGQNWEFHVGYHRLEAEGALAVNGSATSTTLDLGGVMLSAGFLYWF